MHENLASKKNNLKFSYVFLGCRSGRAIAVALTEISPALRVAFESVGVGKIDRGGREEGDTHACTYSHCMGVGVYLFIKYIACAF